MSCARVPFPKSKDDTFLIVPVARSMAPPKAKTGDMVVMNSCDGGGRVFQTVYDGCGNYKEYEFSEASLDADQTPETLSEIAIETRHRDDSHVENGKTECPAQDAQHFAPHSEHAT
eukprot:ANDGO_03455.mRNA.1 hypothetical protein